MNVSVKVVSRPRIEVPQLSVSQMHEVGAYAEKLIESRVDSPSPRDVNNVAAPPLRESYKRRKLKKPGRRGVRDMHFSGEMLGEMGAYRAKRGYVYVGFKTTHNYMKAFKQQKKFEWFGVSAEEESTVIGKANALFGENVKEFGSIGQ